MIYNIHLIFRNKLIILNSLVVFHCFDAVGWVTGHLVFKNLQQSHIFFLGNPA